MTIAQSTDDEMITCPHCGGVFHEDEVLGYPVIPGRCYIWQQQCPECGEPIGDVYTI